MTTPHSHRRTSTRKNLPLRIFVLFGVLTILGLFLGGVLRSRYPSEEFDRISIREGVVLPNLAFTKLNGDVDTLSEMNQKVILINFWATWCEACLEEMPSILVLRDTYQSKGFEVIGVNLDDSPAEIVPTVVKRHGMTFPIYVDPEGKLAEFFDIHAIPRTVIISKNREILLIRDGQEEWDSPYMNKQMNRWLAQ